MSADAQAGVAPASIRQSYRQCLDARRQWMSVRGRTSDDTIREQAHADLHETVLAWFEALQPYISERPGEVKQLWEEAPLYPLEPASDVIDALLCGNEECGAIYERTEDGRLGAGSECPACGLPLEPGEAEVPATTDDGERLWDWACGLKRLAAWTSRTETVDVSGGKWTNESTTIERPERLDPDVLIRAARYLDLAAEECGLLEDTDRALPTGEL